MMPSNDDPIRRSGEALGAYFMGDVSLADALTKICNAAMEAVPAATLAGISMTVDARIGTYVFTNPEVQAIDRPQYDTGDGPCVEAFRTGIPVIVPSTVEPGPFPAFRRVAAEHGLASVVSMPMHAGQQVIGALNLYAEPANAFHDDTVEELQPFATQAAYLLLNHQAYWDSVTLSQNLDQAMRSRAQIEQAKGIIMGTTGCSSDEAFDRLREQSQRENIKLHDIAAEIVQHARRRPPQT